MIAVQGVRENFLAGRWEARGTKREKQLRAVVAMVPPKQVLLQLVVKGLAVAVVMVMVPPKQVLVQLVVVVVVTVPPKQVPERFAAKGSVVVRV